MVVAIVGIVTIVSGGVDGGIGGGVGGGIGCIVGSVIVGVVLVFLDVAPSGPLR